MVTVGSFVALTVCGATNTGTEPAAPAAISVSFALFIEEPLVVFCRFITPVEMSIVTPTTPSLNIAIFEIKYASSVLFVMAQLTIAMACTSLSLRAALLLFTDWGRE